MKDVKLTFGIILGLLICSIVSCATRQRHTGNLLAVIAPTQPPVIEYRDTGRTKYIPAHQLTDSERQALVNRYFAPQFDKLSTTINKQAGSINDLLGVLTSMRNRSIYVRDSVSQRQDSTEKDNAYWKEQAITYMKENAKNVKLASDNTIANIHTSWDIVKILIASVMVIFITIIVIYRKVVSIDKKIKELELRNT